MRALRNATIAIAASIMIVGCGGENGEKAATIGAETSVSTGMTDTEPAASSSSLRRCVDSWNDPQYDAWRQFIVPFLTRGTQDIPKARVETDGEGVCHIILFVPGTATIVHVKEGYGDWSFVYAPSSPKYHRKDVQAGGWNATGDPHAYVELSP
jgi:hypothetical protein